MLCCFSLSACKLSCTCSSSTCSSLALSAAASYALQTTRHKAIKLWCFNDASNTAAIYFQACFAPWQHTSCTVACTYGQWILRPMFAQTSTSSEKKRKEKKRKEKKRKEKKRKEKKRKEKKRKEKTTPFGVNLMRSQVLYRAAQAHHQLQAGSPVAMAELVLADVEVVRGSLLPS